MKNILVVCHDHTLSGANRALMDWIPKKENYNFIFLIPRHNILLENEINKLGYSFIIGHYLVPVNHVGKIGIKEFLKDFIKYFYSITFNKIMLMILFSKFKKMNIDLVHSNSFAVTFGVTLARLLKVKHIWHVREFMEEDHQISHYNKTKIKKYCDYSNAIFISDVIKEKYNLMFNRKSIVIYDNVLYDNSYKKNRVFMEDGICNLLIVGTVSDNKGQKDAIDAVCLLNKNNYKVKLYICGNGHKEEDLKKYVINNKIDNIEFLGYRNDIIEIRKNSDIALMCSKKEALGRVTIEGMYYGNLVIGSDSGCTKYIIDNCKNGLLYENNNIEDLSKKIIYAIENKEKSAKMIEFAKSYAIENFSGDISKKIIDFYKNI